VREIPPSPPYFTIFIIALDLPLMIALPPGNAISVEEEAEGPSFSDRKKTHMLIPPYAHKNPRTLPL